MTHTLFTQVSQEEHRSVFTSASPASSSSSSRRKRWRIPVAATLGTAAFAFVGLKGAKLRFAEVDKAATRSFNDLFESHQELCTDGNRFSFKLELAAPQRDEQRDDLEVLSSSTGATSVVLSKEQLRWRVSTFNYGDVAVVAAIQPSTRYSVTFEKSQKELCLHLESEAGQQTSVCEAAPDYMPVSNFQMKSVGKVTLRTTSDDVRFEQASGSVPVTFSLQDLNMERLWNKNEEWRRVIRSLQEMLAALAGNIMPLDVLITPVAPTQAGRGMMFQASVKTYGGSACYVQTKLWRAVHGTDGLSNSLFAAAVVDRIHAAQVTSSTTGAVLAASASVPGFPTLCSKLLCRDHFPRRLPETARCLGGSCSTVCCGGSSSSKLKQRLPFISEENASVDDLNVRPPVNAPTFVMPDLIKDSLGGRSMREKKQQTLLPAIDESPHATPDESRPHGNLDGSLDGGKSHHAFGAEAATGDSQRAFSGSFELKRVAIRDVGRVEEVAKGALQTLMDHLPLKVENLKVTILPHDQDVPQAKTIGLPAPTAEQREAIGEFRAKYAALTAGIPYSEGLADDATVERAEKLAMQGKPEDVGFQPGESRRLSDDFPEEQERRFSIFFPSESFTVHFEISGCKHECVQKANDVFTEDAIKAALSSLHFVDLEKFSCPGEATTCSAYTCSNPYAKQVNPDNQCFGEDCEGTCCESVTCSAITCQGIDPIAENKDKVCTSKEDCETSCCELKCGDYDCQEGTCAIAGEADSVVPPCHAQLKCCAPQKCCCSEIAWCLACMECMDASDWCDAQEVSGLFTLHKDHKERQLSAASEEDQEALSPIAEADTDLPPKAIEASSQQALREPNSAVAAKERLNQLRRTERNQLELGFESLAKDAAAFHDKNAAHNSPREMAAIQIVKTMARLKKGHQHCKHPRGCDAVSVLSDTVHAVSCGDEGSCWVWRICDAKPRTHFVPKTSLGPIKTVSVLFDTLRIVSGGFGSLFGGVGHVWEWRSGKEVATTRCVTGPILSATEIPEWRSVLLGCGNGYTLKWDWNSGKVDHLPWIGRTSGELLGLLAVLATKCKDAAIAGIGHLFKEQKYVTEQTFLEAIVPKHPGIESSLDCLWNINDFFFGTAFGEVRSVAYVPTKVRFVTGQADGKVRYWNADTGALLRVMRGHRGPVNAVVGELTTQAAISGGDDGTVRVWCLDSGIQKMLFLQEYGGPVLSLAVYPANRIVVVGSADGYVRMWDLHSGMLLCAINTGGGAVNSVAINPSNPLGQILAAGADGYVRVFNPR